MVGRRVRDFWGIEGTVIRWEPLCSGMTDTLVRDDDGQEVWHASHTLRAIDGGRALADRRDVRRLAAARAVVVLQEVRRQHVAAWRTPWAGCEFAKALVGVSIDKAIDELKGL